MHGSWIYQPVLQRGGNNDSLPVTYLQRRSEGATLCVCGPGESLRQGAKRRGVVLHENVWIGREVRENSTRLVRNPCVHGLN